MKKKQMTYLKIQFCPHCILLGPPKSTWSLNANTGFSWKCLHLVDSRVRKNHGYLFNKLLFDNFSSCKWIILLKELILKMSLSVILSLLSTSRTLLLFLCTFTNGVKRGFLSMMFLTGALRTSPGTARCKIKVHSLNTRSSLMAQRVKHLPAV